VCGEGRSVENAKDAKDQQGEGDSGTREVHCCSKDAVVMAFLHKIAEHINKKKIILSQH